MTANGVWSASYTAIEAFDGVLDEPGHGNFWHCVGTIGELAWLQVDLTQSVDIYRVVIFTRNDGGASQQFHSHEVRIGDTPTTGKTTFL